MFLIDARSMIFELRSIRTALQQHNDTVRLSQESLWAEARLLDMIEGIEDAHAFIQTYGRPPSEAGVGTTNSWSDSDDSGLSGPGNADSPRRTR